MDFLPEYLAVVIVVTSYVLAPLGGGLWRTYQSSQSSSEGQSRNEKERLQRALDVISELRL
jgi:hypothetical protein